MHIDETEKNTQQSKSWKKKLCRPFFWYPHRRDWSILSKRFLKLLFCVLSRRDELCFDSEIGISSLTRTQCHLRLISFILTHSIVYFTFFPLLLLLFRRTKSNTKEKKNESTIISKWNEHLSGSDLTDFGLKDIRSDLNTKKTQQQQKKKYQL